MTPEAMQKRIRKLNKNLDISDAIAEKLNLIISKLTHRMNAGVEKEVADYRLANNLMVTRGVVAMNFPKLSARGEELLKAQNLLVAMQVEIRAQEHEIEGLQTLLLNATANATAAAGTSPVLTRTNRLTSESDIPALAEATEEETVEDIVTLWEAHTLVIHSQASGASDGESKE
ncbi:MAG: hypothetical protein H7255_12105 [Ramlibacter sp.]|nr:hypothetical protein [Ramlibacter sp.]